MKPVARVVTSPLFPGLHQHLVALLRGLSPTDWARPTVATGWRVRDVVAHLLDVQARRLSVERDGHAPAPDRDLSDYRALVEHLNTVNASWVGAAGRLSPRLLVDLLDVVGPQLAALVAALDPDEPALFPVAWAGEAASRKWFDIGRDYTELWHHQAQIRLAVGAAHLTERRWLHPVLRLAVRALPRSLAGAPPVTGRSVVLRVEGEAGGVWSAVAAAGGWALFEGAAPEPNAEVAIVDDLAWRLFFNALAPKDAPAAVRAVGDPELVAAVLGMRSVMV